MSEWHQQGTTSERSIYDFAASLISTVFGCGVIPGDQTSTRTFSASGPSNLPVIAVYTDMNQVAALIPGIATSAGAVQALAQRFAMQTVIDVLEIEGRRALLPDFVISNILGQLQVIPLTNHCYVRSSRNQKITKVATAIDGKHLSLSGTLTTTNVHHG
ncbi:hypothetical protein KIN20_018259 [Parelaphostrongylus tenuis]|uniref:Uncharacterized protein n=1 Tax=Parelaphostrongylus tenuis TaxID=148309 RepID=A0AAD5QU83_PARTN|nr:hypothetical protein KIN20_018259 [Parelaphostrongylus tenuis]